MEIINVFFFSFCFDVGNEFREIVIVLVVVVFLFSKLVLVIGRVVRLVIKV